MKKILLILMVATISISFVGCGNTDSDSKSSTNTNSTSEKKSDSTEDSDKNKTVEHKVGETINIKGEELTVTAVNKNYKSGNQFLKPTSGNRYVKADITIKNNTNDTIDVSPFEFKVLDSNGVYHDIKYILDKTLDSTKIAKDGKISGSLTFEVPENGQNLKLIYTPSFWSNDHIEVNI